MPITPLPQFEADLEADRAAYEALEPPKTIVCRFGFMKLVGEFPYSGDAKPGCGSKLVVRTHRGTEVGEMLTSTCPNSGCSKSVSRQEMLEYIENSGGRDYPFFTEGRVLRVATQEDMEAQRRIEETKDGLRRSARAIAERLGLDAKIVEAEPILGGERLTFYYQAEDRVDLRAFSQELRELHRTRIDLRQVGARDEARLTADYERCGQYCCCKNFLKVLKPISMRSAKTQKATLDPLKISGRCGRLMCCLRYEDETYEELRKRLPKRKKHVGTPHGDGIVIDSQILTQLVRVRLDDSNEDVAVPVEELTEPGLQPKPKPKPEKPRREERRRERPGRDDRREPEASEDAGEAAPAKKKRRRRRKRRSGGGDAAQPSGEQGGGDTGRTPEQKDRAGDEAGGSGSKKKRRRRRRRRGGGGQGGSGGGGEGGGPPASG